MMIKGNKNWWARFSARTGEYVVFRGKQLIIITSDYKAVQSYLGAGGVNHGNR